MKKTLLTITALALTSQITLAGGDIPVAAAPIVDDTAGPFYIGLGLSAVSTRDSSVSLSISDEKVGQERTGDIAFLAGYEFNEYLAVEGRYSVSVFEEDILSRNAWAMYVKPQYPINEDFSVYGLLGYGGLQLDSVNGALVSADDSSFQWGLGFAYNYNTNFTIFADYVSVASGMESDIFLGSPLAEVDSDAFTLGVTYNF